MHCSYSPVHQTSAESLPRAQLCARYWWQRHATGSYKLRYQEDARRPNSARAGGDDSGSARSARSLGRFLGHWEQVLTLKGRDCQEFSYSAVSQANSLEFTARPLAS